MEALAIAGLAGLGYVISNYGKPAALQAAAGQVPSTEEGFSTQDGDLTYGGLPPPMFVPDRTPPGAATVPGLPRQPRPTADGTLDLFYRLPSGGSLPSNPMTQPDLYPRNIVFASPVPPTAPPTAVTSQVRMNESGVEAPPVYNAGKTVISPLSGLPIPADEFTHNNMVPFFRGAPKQNMTDDQNRMVLDNHVGMGSTQVGKREQAPMFDPHREPMGNITGMESITGFVQDRMVAPTNRAGERPMEPVQVAPGVGQGYSALGIGGFQQFEVDDIMRQRKTVDELRYASDPKVTYKGVVVPGKSLALQRGEIGETRKYRPDTFFLNEDGERNFVTASENTKPTERAAQVFKYQSREETSTETFGPATASDFKATYTVGSYRAPMVRQHDGFGYRNADGSTYGVSNTDATNNDFGRAGYELQTNQRNVTSERGQALNLTVAGGPKAMTVYDPNDVARTTVRETTGANDWVGIAASASAPTKLTVYDPTDITRITTRNTMAEPDRALNVTRAGMPGSQQLAVPDGVRATTKESISASSAYTGAAGLANAKGEQVYDFAYAMRQDGQRENLSRGRKPVAGNGLLSLFNGEDYMNVSFRKLDTDILNDRDTTVDRVVGPPIGTEAIGMMRPPQELKASAADRNIHEILDSLNDNPYALPVHRIAAGIAGPAEMAAASGFTSHIA